MTWPSRMCWNASRRQSNPKLIRIFSALFGLASLAFVVWCFLVIGRQVHVTTFGLHHGAEYIGHLFPRNQADWRYALRLGPDLVQPLLETIQMAVVGTVSGMLLAFPVSFLAARTGYVPFGVVAIVRAILNMARAVPTLIYALLVIPIAGLGAADWGNRHRHRHVYLAGKAVRRGFRVRVCGAD